MQISVISNLFILKCYFFVASLASMSAQSNVICIGRMAKMSIVPLTRRVLSLRKDKHRLFDIHLHEIFTIFYVHSFVLGIWQI